LNLNINFELKIEKSDFIHNKESFKIDIKTNTKNALRSKKLFELNELYQEHKDIVLELIQKREIYPDSYIDDLFSQYEGSLFKNREDLLRLITGGYIDDKDISEELDLI
jgi:hypothetical protein